MAALDQNRQTGQSWVLAASAVLDAAALAASSIETRDVEAAKICIRTGTRALLAIAEALGRASSSAARATARPSRRRYEAARIRRCSAGMPLRSTTDQEAQWQEFSELRAQYAEALFFIARRTFAPLDGVLAEMVER
jgi:hypothetical protein